MLRASVVVCAGGGGGDASNHMVYLKLNRVYMARGLHRMPETVSALAVAVGDRGRARLACRLGSGFLPVYNTCAIGSALAVGSITDGW